VRSVNQDGRTVAQAVQRQRAAHRRDASSDRDRDRVDGRALSAQAATARQHRTVLPLQHIAGAARHQAREGEEGQGDGGSDAAVH
jgi:hypothetical protein